MPNFTSNLRRATTTSCRHHKKLNKSKKPSKPDDPKPSSTYTRHTIQRITSLLRYAPWPTAQSHLKTLKLDSFLVTKVLKTHPPLQKAWLFFNWAPLHLPNNFKHDKYSYTTMLDMFGEAGQLESMWHCYNQMVHSGIEVDHVVLTSVMNWVAKSGDLEGAVEVWEEMRRKGMGLSVVSYTAYLKVLFVFGEVERAREVYSEMVEAGVKPNAWTYTVLIEYLAGIGKFKAAFEIMNEMQESGFPPDKATCNILAQKCSIAKNTLAITRVLQYMMENSIVLRRPIYLEALEAFKSYSEIDRLLREVNPHLFEGIEGEFDSEPALYDICYIIDRELIFNLLARRDFLSVEHMLNGMIDNDTQMDSELLSIVIQTYCSNNRTSGALLAFQYCMNVNKKLNKATYVSLLGTFLRKNSFKTVVEIIEEMVKVGISLGTYLVSILIRQLGRAGLPSVAENIFSYFPNEQNVVTYTSLLSVYFQVGEVDKGLELYSRMRNQGIRVSCGTYEVLILGLQEDGRNCDAEIYRKEKKCLRWHNHSLQDVSVQESLCNCLFDGT